MPTPFIGQLMAVPFNFAPLGWMLCNGQTLPIASNQGLYAAIGSNYGGTASTFNLPNLQSRVPIGYGSNAGVNYALGQGGGEASVTLTLSQVGPHSHSMMASGNGPGANLPAGNALASNSSMYVSGQNPSTALNSAAIANAGSNTPHENRQPFLTINWCISLTGIFPSNN